MIHCIERNFSFFVIEFVFFLFNKPLHCSIEIEKNSNHSLLRTVDLSLDIKFEIRYEVVSFSF